MGVLSNLEQVAGGCAWPGCPRAHQICAGDLGPPGLPAMNLDSAGGGLCSTSPRRWHAAPVPGARITRMGRAGQQRRRACRNAIAERGSRFQRASLLAYSARTAVAWLAEFCRRPCAIHQSLPGCLDGR